MLENYFKNQKFLRAKDDEDEPDENEPPPGKPGGGIFK